MSSIQRDERVIGKEIYAINTTSLRRQIRLLFTLDRVYTYNKPCNTARHRFVYFPNNESARLRSAASDLRRSTFFSNNRWRQATSTKTSTETSTTSSETTAERAPTTDSRQLGRREQEHRWHHYVIVHDVIVYCATLWTQHTNEETEATIVDWLRSILA
jgi:hypothetical protein